MNKIVRALNDVDCKDYKKREGEGCVENSILIL